MIACEPSTSCVTALPMSWSSAPRFGIAGSTPSSAAIAAAMCADSTRCFSTFWPYDVRNCRRPRSLIISGWMSVIPASRTASSPARRICSSISDRDRSCISSIRAGWIRPSCTSFSSVSRAVSRRTGSKLDRTTASGVSSMIRFTPVVASNARMLRPSRPMMRPFMSSLGSENTETVDSLVCSEATRWIAIVTILRARSSPSSRARCSISRTVDIASRLASSTTCARRASLASLRGQSARSSRARLGAAPPRARAARAPAASFRSRSSSSSERWSRPRRACDRRVCSFCESRSSWRLISSRRVRTSSSVSRRSAPISSFASTSACARQSFGLALGLEDDLLRPALGALGLRPRDRSADHEADRDPERQRHDPDHRLHRFTASEDDNDRTEAHRALFGRASGGCGLRAMTGPAAPLALRSGVLRSRVGWLVMVSGTV